MLGKWVIAIGNKKSILIVNNNMKIGGIQKSLYNLLWTIHDEYRITLLLFEKCGELLSDLPEDVKVIACKSWFRYLGISQAETAGDIKDRLLRGGLAALSKTAGRHVAMQLVLNSQRSLKKEYDCAISFMHNGDIHQFYGGTNEFVLYKTRAKRKAAFLHCDYEKAGGNSSQNNRQYRQFDRIAACSDGCRREFLKVLPDLENRCVTVRNCHRYDVIQKLSETVPVEYKKDICNILFVGRLGEEKGADRGIIAISNAIQKGYPAAFHIVGDGQERKTLEQLTDKLGLKQQVSFYGEQSNPYRFMKNADLLLVPSYHEAAPMVIDEAVSLGLPVLATKTTSTYEMVLQRKAGWECENSQDGINRTLLEVLKSSEALENVRSGLNRSKADNVTAIGQFRKLIE